MSKAIHVNLEVGREGIGFGMRRRQFDPIHAVWPSQQQLSRQVPLPRSRANRMCRGIVEAQRDWKIGQAQRAASAARVSHSKRKPRADRHDSRLMPVADASSRMSGHASGVLIGFWAFETDTQRATSWSLADGMDGKDGVWSMEHPRQGRHPHLPDKTRDMTRHGIRDIEFSSRRVGPAFPVLTGTGKSYQSLHSPLLDQQSINESDEAASLHYHHLIDNNNPEHLGQDPLPTARPRISCHMRRDYEPCDPIFHPITVLSSSLSRVSPQGIA